MVAARIRGRARFAARPIAARGDARFARFLRLQWSPMDEPTKRSRRAIAAMVAACLLALGIGYAGGWVTGRGDRNRLGVLLRRIDALEGNSEAIATERDRIKAERDRLEAQLAASSSSSKPCPRATLSTADAHLLELFAVDYPCGWNVLEDPLQTPAEDSPRRGLMLDAMFFSAVPISKAPREGPLTEITLETWYDDPNAEGDSLPSFDDWLAEAEQRFTKVTRTTVTTRSRVTIAKLQGTMTLFDEPRPALLYVWEWTDRDGTRRISEAFALDPSSSVTKTIDQLVRSFRTLGP
jgi:hypothetical protein